jgi:asparagine synthase (glutamine-hydrolysing)
LISDYAEKKISDEDFQRERKLKNGWVLNTKEELLYYRIFREHFGELEDISWMGRTKGAPEV